MALGCVLQSSKIMLFSPVGDAMTIQIVKNYTAVVGKSFTLTCTLIIPPTALLVVWQKANFTDSIAFLHKSGVPEMSEKYSSRINITNLNFEGFAITIHGLKMEDAGCYKCKIIAKPYDYKEEETCLTIYAGDPFALKGMERMRNRCITLVMLMVVCVILAIYMIALYWKRYYGCGTDICEKMYEKEEIDGQEELKVNNYQSVKRFCINIGSR
ncbi:uncharacterized protein LOC122802003 [Protopterus annectens]|uniref:uncharacterized protein LOC122802003 n=1 Tax=Protopterus annectens TaxID=7888 RepID=UPI001CFAFD09|nr:uncharacterized protein LOC122802003 [Protopterus annectens]